jgi:hypothetical protein
MKRMLTTSLMLLIGLSTLTLGPTAYANAGRSRLDLVFTTYELVDFNPRIAGKQAGGARLVSLPLGGVSRDIVLVPHSLRAASYRATATTDAGTVDVPAAPVSTYKGTVAGEPGSDVRMLVQDDLVMGYVRTETDFLFVEPARAYDPDMPSDRLVIYRDADVRPEHRGECGSRGLIRYADALAGEVEDGDATGGNGGTSTAPKTAALRTVEIATDADFEFFRAHGSSANAVVEGILNQVDGIYTSELDLTFTITGQHVWQTSNDPYNTSNQKRLLRQFKKEWNRAGGVGSGVSRDVAHLFTGRDLIGASLGQAFTGVVCSDPASAYSLSQASATSILVKTVAHQLGHNFGVTAHDDERVPAVDECDGDGPLMCTTVQSAGANVFSQVSKNEILSYVASRGTCLDAGAPPPPPPPARRRVRGDFDGDGKADLSSKGGNFWLIDLAGNGFGTWDIEVSGFGFDGAVAVPADYDGDLKDDVSLKGSDGVWVIDFASNGFQGTDVAFSGYGDERAIPVPADYDGDGKADLSVKSNAGEWYIDYAVNGFGVWDVLLSGYGFGNAHPMPADYDGDTIADLSVKVDDGFWLIDFASNGFGVWDVEFFPYGEASAHAVPADYDGDGKADLSVKTDVGEWFIDYSAGGFGTQTDLQSFMGYGDDRAIPAPADYDGDGKADLSVKSAAGEWFIDYASNGFGVWDLQLSGYGASPPVIPGN